MADLKERIEMDEEGITEWGITQFFDWTDQEMAKVGWNKLALIELIWI
jgi:hypothetical protein